VKVSKLHFPGLSEAIVAFLFGVVLSTTFGANPQAIKQADRTRRPAQPQVAQVKPLQPPATKSISSSDFASLVATAFKGSSGEFLRRRGRLSFNQGLYLWRVR